MCTMNFPMFKLDLEKAEEEPEIKLLTSIRSSKKQENYQKKARELPKNIYFCFIDYVKTFDCVWSQQTVENS